MSELRQNRIGTNTTSEAPAWLAASPGAEAASGPNPKGNGQCTALSTPGALSGDPGAPATLDTLHQVANAMTTVMINAQAVGWKLPPHSRVKRQVREIERSAQRGGELLKSLLQRFATVHGEAQEDQDYCGQR